MKRNRWNHCFRKLRVKIGSTRGQNLRSELPARHDKLGVTWCLLFIKEGRLILSLVYIISTCLISESHSKNCYSYGKHWFGSIAFYPPKRLMCYIYKICGWSENLDIYNLQTSTWLPILMVRHVLQEKMGGVESSLEGLCSRGLER